MTERTPERLKHLEFIQSNITRMHEAALSMKRFAIVAFAVGCALARHFQDAYLFGVTTVVVFAFWMLDAKYLQVERVYRILYDRVSNQPNSEPTSFSMKPEKYNLLPLSEFASWSSYLLYAPLVVVLAVIWCLSSQNIGN